MIYNRIDQGPHRANENFPDSVQNVGSFEDLATKIESNFDNVDVTFKQYDEVG